MDVVDIMAKMTELVRVGEKLEQHDRAHRDAWASFRKIRENIRETPLGKVALALAMREEFGELDKILPREISSTTYWSDTEENKLSIHMLFDSKPSVELLEFIRLWKSFPLIHRMQIISSHSSGYYELIYHPKNSSWSIMRHADALPGTPGFLEFVGYEVEEALEYISGYLWYDNV